MARDPRGGSAFTSGMRGREKPKIAGSHGGTMGTEADSKAGGESKQGPNAVVGNPDGVGLSAYSSGMRGSEKPTQKSASGSATYGQQREGSGGGENRQAPDTQVGKPDGHNDAATGERKGVTDSHLQSTVNDAKKMGIEGNNTEQAATSVGPSFEEDGEHIYAKIPKASLKKRGGVNAG